MNLMKRKWEMVHARIWELVLKERWKLLKERLMTWKE